MTHTIAIANSTTSTSYTTAAADTRSSTKRQKKQHQPLLPGLPDHIAQICLSLVHPSILYSVCRSWRSLIYYPSFPPFLSIYALLLSSETMDETHHSNSLEFSAFDPISSKWNSLPPPPIRLLVRHPSFISRNLPIQSISVSNNLALLAATTHHFVPALPRPLVFSPFIGKWAYGPHLAAPRRWCVAGTARGAVYVASGIGSHFNAEVARTVEKWDLHKQIPTRNCHLVSKNGRFEKNLKWEKMGLLKDGKFCREAIDAVGWRGKLCMVNVKGDARKEGAVYDVKNDTWGEMPDGMLAGWRGPAAAIAEEIIFVVDESKGALRKYVPEKDSWEGIMESEKLKGAEHIAGGGGRVCVVCSGGVDIVVVDVVATPPRLWVVDTPTGFQVAGIHILPRISQPEFENPVVVSESMV